jgi:hypothetical protein
MNPGIQAKLLDYLLLRKKQCSAVRFPFIYPGLNLLFETGYKLAGMQAFISYNRGNGSMILLFEEKKPMATGT